MPIYNCCVCKKNEKIEVYTMANADDFVCPSCLYDKKIEIYCASCGERTNITISNMINKCLSCYKKSVIKSFSGKEIKSK